MFMLIVLLIICLIIVVSWLYLRHEKFGAIPSKERKIVLDRSPNYRNGKFHNKSETPQLAEGYSMSGVLLSQIFNKVPRKKPTDTIPSVKTDLIGLSREKNALVWFGHSSYYMQIDGYRYLIDPVFSGNASPIPGTATSFKGTDIYSVADIPEIDYLLITHDHYDHLDYETVKALVPKVKKIICGLGVGAHLQRWGYKNEQIFECDWGDDIELNDKTRIHVEPARHFSGRSFSRNNTLWVSFVLHSQSKKIYLGGDSGYDTHFAEIGEKHGAFDLAILDNGQYNHAWKYIHALPEEVLQAAVDLKAKKLLPVHSSKFMLAQHSWDAPLQTITELNGKFNLPLITPKIGELVDLDSDTQVFARWWKGIH